MFNVFKYFLITIKVARLNQSVVRLKKISLLVSKFDVFSSLYICIYIVKDNMRTSKVDA